MSAQIGIVTVSDRASRGEYADRSGPAIHAYLVEVLTSEWMPVARVIPDETDLIATTIEELSAAGCCLIITSGGTGPAPRDVTPEATERVCQKLLPGFGEAMRAASLHKVPTAVLSRQTAGVCNGALVINLPGNPKAIRECLDAVFAAVPDAVDLIGGPVLETDSERVLAHRPHGHPNAS